MTTYTVTGKSAPYTISDGTLAAPIGDIPAVAAWLAEHLQFTYPDPSSVFGQTGSGDTVQWNAGEATGIAPAAYQVAHGPGQVDVWLNWSAFYEATDDHAKQALAKALAYLLPRLHNGDSFSLGTEE